MKRFSLAAVPAPEPADLGRGAAARQSLLAAAIEVFGERGLEAATTRDIAQRAGQNIATIAYHFGNKEGLYLGVAEHIAGLLLARTAPLLDEADRFDCAVWLTLPTRPGGDGAGRPDFPPAEADAWNERVRAEAASRPHVHVSEEWQRTVEADGGDRLLQDDGVHPVRAGHLALAAAMDRALAEECGR